LASRTRRYRLEFTLEKRGTLVAAAERRVFFFFAADSFFRSEIVGPSPPPSSVSRVVVAHAARYLPILRAEDGHVLLFERFMLFVFNTLTGHALLGRKKGSRRRRRPSPRRFLARRRNTKKKPPPSLDLGAIFSLPQQEKISTYITSLNK
jgi:hypothetical protein